MTRTWRHMLALAAASGLALTVGISVGVSVASAASPTQTSSASCTVDGYTADAKVSYRRAGATLYIGSVKLNIDKRAGQNNRVRIDVRDEESVVFSYTSGAHVTAGPYLFDYSDNPIKVASADKDDEIVAEVGIEFDTKGGQNRSDNRVDFEEAEKAASSSCKATLSF